MYTIYCDTPITLPIIAVFSFKPLTALKVIYGIKLKPRGIN